MAPGSLMLQKKQKHEESSLMFRLHADSVNEVFAHLIVFQVNFMITAVLGLRRRRQADNNQQQQQSVRMSRAGGQLYRDLAQASGGQAVEVTKSQLLEAINILTESTSSSLVQNSFIYLFLF